MNDKPDTDISLLPAPLDGRGYSKHLKPQSTTSAASPSSYRSLSLSMKAGVSTAR